MAPVVALRISTLSTPNSLRHILFLACSSTSAYEVLAAPLRVTVTADARGVRGSIVVLAACPCALLISFLAPIGFGTFILGIGITVALSSLLFSLTVVTSFFLLTLLGFTTVHSPSSLFTGGTALGLAGPAATVPILPILSGGLGFCPVNYSMMSYAIWGSSSSILLSGLLFSCPWTCAPGHRVPCTRGCEKTSLPTLGGGLHSPPPRMSAAHLRSHLRLFFRRVFPWISFLTCPFRRLRRKLPRF
jgi:hypothetical protein